MKSSYSEPENEAITYSFSVNDTIKGAWIVMTENSTHLHLTGTPDNSQFGDVELTFRLDDPHSDTGSTEDIITI